MVDYTIENELRPNLNTGEQLIWTGRPKSGMLLRKADFFLIPFSLLWAGFAIFWETTAITSDSPIFFKIWGIPFVLIGLYITIGRFFYDAKKRASTIYGITKERIIIKTGVFNKEVKSLQIKTLPEITLSQESDNTGSIILGPANYGPSILFSSPEWSGPKNNPPRLELIPEVKQVYDNLINLQRQ